MATTRDDQSSRGERERDMMMSRDTSERGSMNHPSGSNTEGAKEDADSTKHQHESRHQRRERMRGSAEEMRRQIGRAHV